MRSALATDLYELTMMAGYDGAHLEARATFELYVRRLPERRSFLVAAGLPQAIDFLLNLRFTAEEIDWLRTIPNLKGVPATFFDRTLAGLRFTGDVWAMPEGTIVFPGEPLLRISAPLIQAQVVETTLLSNLTFQTSVASKAARIVRAARGRDVMEFGSRRAHGPDAALYAARAAYLAGCASTSNVEAGFRFGIPLSGTMAHSWVTSFADELEAFRTYANIYDERSIFLIDTYDTIAAARKIVDAGLRPAAVRLDSGDLATLGKQVREIFDQAGLQDTRIYVSGDLDEHGIEQLLDEGAPVDGFGVGTALSTSKDAPALGGIYKLVEIERSGAAAPVMKLSGDKASYPGRKQVWRRLRNGVAVGDTIALDGEPGPPDSHALLRPVVRGGRLVEPIPPLRESCRYHQVQIAQLPDELRRLDVTHEYPVAHSRELESLTDRLRRTLERQSRR